MDIKQSFDKLFTIDNNFAVLCGNSKYTSEIRDFITNKNKEIKNDRDTHQKIINWFDHEKYLPDANKKFKLLFGFEFDCLPSHLKNFNLCEDFIIFSSKKDVLVDPRYTEYLRQKWHILRDHILPDNEIFDTINNLSVDPHFGTYCEDQFICCFAGTVDYCRKHNDILFIEHFINSLCTQFMLFGKPTEMDQIVFDNTKKMFIYFERTVDSIINQRNVA